MSKPIHVIKKNSHGVDVVAGTHVVGPMGQIVLKRPDQPIKAGWRYATDADITPAPVAKAVAPKHDK